ncbi:MAG: hypothetical protein PHP02_02105 [Eubacteriales bacterium]|nr:hypothetical protein [Eubacteriales bacterium]
MVDLFFGNLWSLLSTVLVAGVLAWIIITALRHQRVEHWGRKTAVLAASGLLLCAFAAMRDDYALALQGGTGLFALDAMQNTLACLAAALIAAALLSTLILKNQACRKAAFFVLSFAVVFKIGLIEISRALIL